MDLIGKVNSSNISRYSALERLPNELLHKIFQHIITPAPAKYWLVPHSLPGGPSMTNCIPSLKPCLLTSKTLNVSAIILMYREPKIKFGLSTTSSSTSRLFTTIERDHQLRSLVRNLDLTQNKSKEQFTLSISSLSLLPQLRSVRLSINDIPSPDCLNALLFATPHLQCLSIDLSHPSENAAQLFQHVFDSLPSTTSPLSTLRITSSHTELESTQFYVPEDFFTTLLPRLSNLRVLDLSTTTISSEALSTLSPNARLTHISLNSCTHLFPSLLVTFLTTHPATSTLHTLVAGSLTHENKPLSEHHINTLLSSLPSTLRSLDLSNSLMGPSNNPLLQAMRLEELSVGGNLSLDDIEALVLGGRYEYTASASQSLISVTEASNSEEAKPTNQTRNLTVLSPLQAAVALCQFRQRLSSVKPITNTSSSSTSPKKKLSLRYLDISSLPAAEQGHIKQSVLLAPETHPLEVIEMRGLSWDDYNALPRVCRSAGWKEKWVGERIWVER